VNVGLVRSLLAACLLIGVAVADAGAATPPGLLQKPGAAGCIADMGGGPCVDGRALGGARSVTVSPDGRSVYVGSEFSAAVAVFDRAADGMLVQKPGAAGCVSETGAAPCLDGMALGSPIGGGPFSVTVSPDGTSVYAASNMGSAIAVFDRAPDGTLTQKPGLAGCISDTGAGPCVDGRALSFLRSVTVSPDGASVYATSEVDDAVSVFDRAPDGRLTQKAGTAGCISNTGAGPCGDGRALDEPASVTVSPDGENAYVASEISGAVAVFDRAANGTLTQRPGIAGCLSDDGAGPCVDATALADAKFVTVSPDGHNAYVASSGSRAVAVLDRAGDGSLTQKAGTAGCISDSGAGPCVDGTALFATSSVAVSPDGASTYVTSFLSSAVAVFDRAADGTLTQKPGTAGCISDSGAGPCVDGTALNEALSVAVSPDSHNAYVASEGGTVAVFDRRPLTSPPAPPPPQPPPRLPQPGCPQPGTQAVGTPGADALVGIARSDVLFGLAGADLLRGGAGRDCLYGGEGDDRLFGGSGADRLFGGAGDDRLDGEDGRDNLRGAGSGRLTGGDRLSGGAGDDGLTDRRGSATLSGGAGNDRVDARDASGMDRRRADTVRCGRGRDVALVDAADHVARDCEHVVRRRSR
jgi:DNA-binding beta-propeller fold protein YncE